MSRACLALVLLAAIAVPAAAEPLRIVSESRGSVTFELVLTPPLVSPLDTAAGGRCRVSMRGFDTMDIPGAPMLPVRRFAFAVTAREGVRLEILEQETAAIEGVAPVVALEKGSIEEERAALERVSPIEDQRFVTLAGVETVRKRPVAFIDVRPALYDPAGRRLVHLTRLTARLVFPERDETAAAAGRAPWLADDLVRNAARSARMKPAAARAAAQREPFDFARSDRWLRLTVTERGMYAIGYNDLHDAGVDPSTIDPATLRLLSGGPSAEPDSLSDGGSWLESYRLVEHALLVESAGGSFQPGDSIIFFGVGVKGWADEYAAGGDPWSYVEHPYETRHFYYLTWGGDFAGAPRRMPSRSVAPTGAADTVITWYEARIHRERDVLYDPLYTDDRWYWLHLTPNGTSTFSETFACPDIADANGYFRTRAYGPFSFLSYENSCTYRVNGAVVGTLNWTVPYGYYPANMPTLLAPVANLAANNAFVAAKPLDKQMYFLFYEILYHRLLKASQGALDFAAPARSLVAEFSLAGFPTGERLLFDVSDHVSPVICAGAGATPGGLSFEDAIGGWRHRYFAVARAALRKPGIALAAIPSLRDAVSCADMVIIYHPDFRDAALALRRHRENAIQGVARPTVEAIDVTSVYDNFSGGHKDPIAIRNYLKFLYDRADCAGSGDPALKYVLLVGNGTYDPRDNLAQGNDFIPFYMNIGYANESEAIEDEDFLVKLDDGSDHAPDVAIGRMSVLTAREANAWAQRIVDYEERPAYGTWRNKAILCADDEYSTSQDTDFEFLISTEELTYRTGPFPSSIDFVKIYLHLYPFLGIVKPEARRDFLAEWSDGALVVNYNGHGSPQQMADERVMVSSDIYSLTNGPRRPLMLSFSCSVGDLDSPYHRSMAQELVTYDGGGAIATISAAAPTYLYPNKLLNTSIYRSLFTSKDSTGTRPVGYALMLAKYSIAAREGYESNNVKYICLGDPALELAMPEYRVEHDIASIDTMRTGELYRVDGAVRAGGEVLSTFNGTADVSVQEAEQNVREYVPSLPPVTLVYTLPGKELFRGTVDVTAGRFSVEYVVPRRCRAGTHARIRTYASSLASDAVGACDTLRIVPSDTLRPNLGPPRINLYFAGQATRVKTGSHLLADIEDPDGIAILGSDPQSSIFLEFDGSGYPIYVTDYFAYEHGSYTSGTVEYPLHAGFSPGPHTALIKAFDNLGAAAVDTLRFEIVEEGVYAVSDVFNFPNPFAEGTNFVFQVTNPAAARLAVFNVSGTRVWEKRLEAAAGFNSVWWDGRDAAGDRLANGTYLYVLEVDFRDAYHREERVEGKAVLLR